MRCVQLDLFAMGCSLQELPAIHVVEKSQFACDHRVELESDGVELVSAVETRTAVFEHHGEGATRVVSPGDIQGPRIGAEGGVERGLSNR